MDIENRVLNIMSLVFQKEIINGDISMQTEHLWDSLKHIELIITLEEEFDISFNPDEIPRLNSFNLIVSKIKELKNA